MDSIIKKRWERKIKPKKKKQESGDSSALKVKQFNCCLN